ncbi:MAG: ABC transporter permease [Prolixibacteraceae bacterium]|nr:ABC transporter permease [Prolixibacteraceae bacterium]
MNYTNSIKIAVNALKRNKTRSFLTMLGIIIGVASVIAMLAIGEGSKKSIQDQMSSMGTNMIFAMPGADMHHGVRQSKSTMESMDLKDVEEIEKLCPDLINVTPIVNSSGQAIYKNNNWPTTITGANPSYLNIRQYEISDGRNYTEKESKSFAKVCIIGHTIVKNLFPDGNNPIGQTIRFQNIPLKIIGIIKEKGENSMGEDQDDLIIAPFTCVQKRILAISHVNSIMASVTSEEVNDKAIEEMTLALRKSHKIKNGDDDDFNIRSQSEMVETFSSISDVLTILLGTIAGISLLIGGIGIMNIMYVSVTERTREIGLRLSVGGRSKDILTQFLIESILISIIGGIIGILLGLISSKMVSVFLNWPIVVLPMSVILSFIVCSFIGIFFGWYPARKAAGLNPIDALRYE